MNKFVAKKSLIKNLLEAVPSNDGWLVGGKFFFRCNVVATVVALSDFPVKNVMLDDGTGQLVCRFFSDLPQLSNLKVGQVVLVIGLLREFEDCKYLVPDIFKISSVGWLKLRLRELDEDVRSKLFRVLKILDNGNGAFVDQLLEKAEVDQDLIDSLLVSGELFEVSPGRVKILE